MHTRRSRRWIVLPVSAALVLAACGDDDETSDTAGTEAVSAATDAASDTTAATDAATDTTAATAASSDTTAASDGTAAAGAVDLSADCPATVTILTDWNPEAEHGWIYQMVGDDYEIDKDAVAVRGSLVAPGEVDTGVDIEIRSGGPAIGFQTVTSQLYADDEILLGYVYTDEAIQNSAEFPTVAIMAGMEKNPQMIMWDPETYPEIESIEDIGEAGILVRYFGGAAYMDYFTQTGILSPDQVDGSYDGTPANFVAAQGRDAQQGFGSAEPYFYENELADWGKPVEYAYINDAGWENYAESIATRPENLETYGACFEQLVPIIQQSSIDYINDPAATNELILEAVETYDNGWVYTPGQAEYAVETMKADGLIGNGPDDTLGNFDLDRVNALIEKAIPVYESLGQAPKEGLTAEDVVTNEFIDESIGL